MKKAITLSEINESTLPFDFSGFVGIDLGDFKIGGSQVLVILMNYKAELNSFTLLRQDAHAIYKLSTKPSFSTIQFKLAQKGQNLQPLNFEVSFLLPNQMPTDNAFNIINHFTPLY
jgi:hypothetical protein